MPLSFTRRHALQALPALLATRPAPGAGERIWTSEPPPGCPFEPSRSLKGVAFTGRHASYTDADTWYPSWASDGNLYSPWTDGKVNGLQSISGGRKATTGHATITGDDPLRLRVTNQAVYAGDPAPYGGRYPCGSLVFEGIWYYGTYCLMDTDGDPSKGLNWDVLGPCVGFRWSRDFGRSWTDTPHTPSSPLFGEPSQPGGKVKIGAPHFVDFGKNMGHSPDGKAYLVGHGASDPDPADRPANLSWITGDQVYMARVKPSPETINDRSHYEFLAGRGWTRDLAKARPLGEWNNHMGCVTMTYNAPLKKYLMCVTDGTNTVARFHTYILESDRITGPWRMAAYLRHFGPQAYFVNIPSKFVSEDGRTAWLCYAANFTNGYLGTKFTPDPPGSRYGMCLQELRLL